MALSKRDQLRAVGLANFRLPFFLFIGLALFAGCQKDLESENVVYQNDFEASDLSDIRGGELFQYQGSQMLGTYNKSGFVLDLADLPTHDYLSISLDLYVHDSWDGNNNGPDGPDIWVIEVDDAIFETTFSNTPCESLYCLKQSYPGDFPMVNEPTTGALEINLPVVCHNERPVSRTTHYRISKLFSHNKGAATIRFYDRLVQTNTEDQLCDESWSLDNLQIVAVAIK